MKALVLAAVLLSLGACQSAPALVDDDIAHAQTCGAEDYAHLQNQRESEIDRVSLPPGARVICHNCSYTKDYRPSRLNLWLDADGRVARLDCG